MGVAERPGGGFPPRCNSGALPQVAPETLEAAPERRAHRHAVWEEAPLLVGIQEQVMPSAPSAGSTATKAPAFAPVVPLDVLIPRLVRRVAVGSGDGQATARIELGAGELEGATLLISVHGAELSIDLQVPVGVSAELWRERIEERLRARGLSVAAVSAR